MPVLVRQVLAGLGVVLLQWLVFGRLQLWGAYPDVVLLFVAWTALRHGRVAGTVAGFLSGFLMDAVYGTWGLHMLVKTLTGFVVGLFQSQGSEGPRLGPLQAGMGALSLALIHHGVIVVLLALVNATRTPNLITALWIGSSLYTALLAVLWVLVRAR